LIRGRWRLSEKAASFFVLISFLIYFVSFVEKTLKKLSTKQGSKPQKAFAPAQAAQGGANIGVFDVFDQNYLIRRALFSSKINKPASLYFCFV